MNTIQASSDEVVLESSPYGFRLHNGDEIDDELVQINTPQQNRK